MPVKKVIKVIIVVLFFLITILNVYGEVQISFEPNDKYAAGDVLTIRIDPDKYGVFKYVYIYDDKNTLRETIILNNCKYFTCYTPLMIRYNLPLTWHGNYSVAVYDYGINDYVLGYFNVESKIVFNRNLKCNRCSSHKAPPLTDVEMTISASGKGNLVDYFEK